VAAGDRAALPPWGRARCSKLAAPSLGRLDGAEKRRQKTFVMSAILPSDHEAAPIARWGKKWGKVPHIFQPIST
jgi:hypothetical protein